MGRNGEEINLRKSSYISSKEMVISIIIIEGAREILGSATAVNQQVMTGMLLDPLEASPTLNMARECVF